MLNISMTSSRLCLYFCLFISSFLLISCDDSSSSEVSLKDTHAKRSYLTNTDYTLQGTSSENGTVDVYTNDIYLSSTTTDEKSFSFPLNFESTGSVKVTLKLKDSDNKIKAEASYNLVVKDPSDLFTFHFPPYSGGKKHTLWATYYYLPQVSTVEDGYPLLDHNGDSLGPVLSRVDWCNAAMEGSVYVIDHMGAGTTYNYYSEFGHSQADCSDLFDTDVSQTRFRLAFGQYGDGVEDYKLIPYRTIAVDPNYFPYGTVLYIPRARGNKIILPDGSVTYHDGYFFAGDTGRGILTTHIDVYIGVADSNPFEWVRSYQDQTFDIQVVTDKSIITKLRQIHK